MGPDQRVLFVPPAYVLQDNGAAASPQYLVCSRAPPSHAVPIGVALNILTSLTELIKLIGTC